MKIIPVECPKCVAGFDIEEGRKTCFCQYCGTKLLLDDGSTTRTTITAKVIRDEARIKEAEVKARQQEIEAEQQRRKQKEKTIITAIGIATILVGLLITAIGITDERIMFYVGLLVLLFGVIILIAGSNVK